MAYRACLLIAADSQGADLLLQTAKLFHFLRKPLVFIWGVLEDCRVSRAEVIARINNPG